MSPPRTSAHHAAPAEPDPPRPYPAVAFDLDGTLYVSGVPIPGAPEAVSAIRSSGRAVLFVSNNPLRTPRQYAERLTGIGIPATEDEVVTSAVVVAQWLGTEAPDEPVFAVGEPILHQQLHEAGIATTPDWREASVVLASFDRTFTYDTWRDACFALRAGARFVATNPDATCPTADGEIPDCGGIIAALETSSGRQLDAVAGKPSTVMSARIRELLGVAARDILVVGDRLATDIALAHHAGFASAVVLSGVSDRAAVAATEWRPTHVLDSIAALPHLLGVN
ncbi:HAD-IIA family hydrolase [Actinobacteria bacterium YIM 96077]|uniref:HAD family hydrolase n=1 Tax=Phytoactinopolyspora halophila TaxID=1981511 RepID=A0A329QPD0_9ACTN|nr:HAD-IIA family hydrolase [Phytoactinopolyspora halophila]AYY12351.1 HAD-IIA family hydrolase [Actinobacteria bacterium YIM 96077]RAW13731.1 HAD family hydrolase [Phytoactinopolyspora halophila]